MFWVRSVGSQTILQSYTILYTIIPFLGSLYDPKRFCNVPSVKKKKKKKKEMIRLFWFPRAPHLTPLPTTHFHPPLFSFLAGSLFSFFHFLSLLFTYTHTHSLPHSPAILHSKPHHLTIIFSARSPEKYSGTPKHLHHFI